MGEKMQWSEAEAVVRAYRKQQGASADVDVATLARALGTDAAEVRRLAGRKRRFTDRSGVLSAGLAFAAALAFLALAGPSLLRKSPFVASQPNAGPTIVRLRSMPLAPDFAERVSQAQVVYPPFPGYVPHVEIFRVPDEPL